MTKRIIVAMLGLLALSGATNSANARWYGNGSWTQDDRWRAREYYYGYNYRRRQWFTRRRTTMATTRRP